MNSVPNIIGNVSVRVLNCLIGKSSDIETFNKLFVLACREAIVEDPRSLKKALSLFLNSLNYAGHYKTSVILIIGHFRQALPAEDRYGNNAPWNCNLSSYGILALDDLIYTHRESLRLAWPHIEAINNDLKAIGLGWDY